MAFKNEYIPPLEQETSEFLKRARLMLRAGFSKFDRWTVDSGRDMVMYKRASGHSLESQNEDYWSFIDASGEYCFDTTLISKSEVSEDEVAIKRAIGFRGESNNMPSAETIGSIKEALREYKDWGTLSGYKRCQLTVIVVATGREL